MVVVVVVVVVGYNRYLLAAKRELDGDAVQSLAGVLCDKSHLTANTALAALQPSVERQLQAVYVNE